MKVELGNECLFTNAKANGWRSVAYYYITLPSGKRLRIAVRST
jgi:hypothetical protein